jgi:hypothetical protein
MSPEGAQWFFPDYPAPKKGLVDLANLTEQIASLGDKTVNKGSFPSPRSFLTLIAMYYTPIPEESKKLILRLIGPQQKSVDIFYKTTLKMIYNETLETQLAASLFRKDSKYEPRYSLRNVVAALDDKVFANRVAAEQRLKDELKAPTYPPGPDFTYFLLRNELFYRLTKTDSLEQKRRINNVLRASPIPTVAVEGKTMDMRLMYAYFVAKEFPADRAKAILGVVNVNKILDDSNNDALKKGFVEILNSIK